MTDIKITFDDPVGGTPVYHVDAVEFDHKTGFVIADENGTRRLLDRGRIVEMKGPTGAFESLISSKPQGFDGLQTRDAGDSDDPILDITPCPECGDADLIDSLGGIKRCPECGHEVEG